MKRKFMGIIFYIQFFFGVLLWLVMFLGGLHDLSQGYLSRVNGNNWTLVGTLFSLIFVSGIFPLWFSFLLCKMVGWTGFVLGEIALIFFIGLHFYAVLLVYGHTSPTYSFMVFILRDVLFAACEGLMFYFLCKLLHYDTAIKPAKL